MHRWDNNVRNIICATHFCDSDREKGSCTRWDPCTLAGHSVPGRQHSLSYSDGKQLGCWLSCDPIWEKQLVAQKLFFPLVLPFYIVWRCRHQNLKVIECSILEYHTVLPLASLSNNHFRLYVTILFSR